MAHDSGTVSWRGHVIPSSQRFTAFFCGDDGCGNIHVIAFSLDDEPICEMTFSETQVKSLLKEFP